MASTFRLLRNASVLIVRTLLISTNGRSLWENSGHENDYPIIFHGSYISLRRRFAYSASGLPTRLRPQQCQHVFG